MKDRTRSALRILQVAILVGVLGDILLRQTPWGANVFLFNAVFVGGMVVLLRRFRPELLTVSTLSLFAAQLFFAGMFVLRDSIELRVADTFAILILMCLVVVPKLKSPMHLAGAFHYLSSIFWSGIHVLFAPFALVFGDVEWSTYSNNGSPRKMFSVLRGIAITAPLILIFGALFMSADARYEGLVRGVFNVDIEVLFSHLIIFSFLSWAAAGFLRGVLITSPGDLSMTKTPSIVNVPNAENGEGQKSGDNSGVSSVSLPNNLSILEHINISDPPDHQTDDSDKAGESQNSGPEPKKPWQWDDIDNSVMPSGFTLGTIEMGIIFGLINLLFLSFVVVQIPYLFGGMDYIQATPDFKLAEYARRGFGELVTVSALVLPMLLLTHWLVRRDQPAAGKMFRILGGTQIVLLFVIMASAVQRLVLLTGELGYGLTTVRFYPMIFIIWLAIVFIWFGTTVMRGARQYFAWGALWSAIMILGMTNIIDPDAYIVRTNLELMRQGREFDAVYNAQLSDDALPVLFNGIPEMNAEDQQRVAVSLAKRYCHLPEERDLRSFNISRWQAARILGNAHEFISSIDCSKVFEMQPKDRDF